MKQTQVVILMGVSSTGKSSVGKAVADMLEMKFIDGDDLHPRANILKMASGKPLDDQDRLPWLERINDAAFALRSKHESGIIICSALKRKYRDLIRQGNSGIIFLHLHANYDVILQRLLARKGHFMKANMLQSQYETLEEPQADETDVYAVNVDASFEEVCQQAKAVLEQILQANAHNVQ
ncbi:gluconate kinase [Psittacicella hinzii]|uniref:Gluconokinase n=1 Tax=Psittacicella hinzii TaxID=2028575 RepID=A0A3A1Y3C9_9GAMM|nr:gluconokinase [Psittacicella hinzii]RIY31951.1 gluconate kinase [Psittacicella hinzii]